MKIETIETLAAIGAGVLVLDATAEAVGGVVNNFAQAKLARRQTEALAAAAETTGEMEE